MKILASVRFKLLFLSLLVVFVITSLVVWSDIEDTRQRLTSMQKEKAVLLSDVIKQSIMLLMLENRWQELQTMMEGLTKSNPELKEVRIFNPLSGRIIVSNEKDNIGKTIYKKDWDRFVKNEEEPFVIEKAGSIFATRVVSIKNMPSCYKCHPPSRKTLGVLDLDVEVSLSAAQQYIKESAYKHIAGLIIGFVLIGLIFMVGGERLINTPLRALTRVMKRVASGDLSVRAEARGKDEFGEMASVFNQMIDTLEAAKQEVESCHMQQMERAAKLASLGEIISGIAHEIKNPLTGISCAVQVFNSELSEDDSRKPAINEVLNQVKRLDRIVKDLLSYAKPKTPVFVLSKAQDVLEKTLFLVYPKAKRQHIVIDNQVGRDLPGLLMDPDQMQQVFLNIIINAIHSMPDAQGGGVLTISARRTRDEGRRTKDEGRRMKDEGRRMKEQSIVHRLSEQSERASIVSPDFIEISIEDTGKGIASGDLPYIFEPFFTRKTQGTGLGLSISRKIVQEHGGEITAESEVGKGSVFTVYLPMKDNILN